MKHYILTAALIIFFTSCQEEEEITPTVDPFVGSWLLENTETGLNVSFDITQTGDEISFHNIGIEYPEIPETEVLTYHIETYHRYPVNTGYEEIKVYGSGDEVWITLIMTHNRIHLNTQDLLEVYNLKIDIINREPIELQNQVFVKTE